MHLVLKTVLLRVIQRYVVLGKACLSCSVLEQYEPNHRVSCVCTVEVLTVQTPLCIQQPGTPLDLQSGQSQEHFTAKD